MKWWASKEDGAISYTGHGMGNVSLKCVHKAGLYLYLLNLVHLCCRTILVIHYILELIMMNVISFTSNVYNIKCKKNFP